MILPLHIIIAVSSLMFAAYGFYFPSKTKLIVNYIMIALTLTTGTVLVISAPAHMTEGCMVGLCYTLIMAVATIAARHKLIQMEQV